MINISNRTVGVALCVLLWVGASHGCESQETECKYVAGNLSEAILKDSLRSGRADADLKIRTWDTPNGELIVSALSTLAPSRGVVSVSLKNGELIHETEIGYVIDIELDDITGDGSPEIVVEHQAGTGTGWQRVSKSCFQYRNGEVTRLLEYVKKEWGYGTPGSEDYEVEGAMLVTGAGRVTVSTTRYDVKYNRETMKYERTGKKEATKQLYWWDSEKQSFQTQGSLPVLNNQ